MRTPIPFVDTPEGQRLQLRTLEQQLDLHDQILLTIVDTVRELGQRVDLLEEYTRLRFEDLQRGR